MDLDSRTFPPRATGSMFKSDLKPVAVERRTKKVSKTSALRKAYEAVDKRDGRVCQITGRKLVADHDDEAKRLTRDHLAPRSTAPDRVTDLDNLLTCSWLAHKELQASRILPVDKDGHETTYVSKIAGYRWSERVKNPPFKLGRKEWKAERNR